VCECDIVLKKFTFAIPSPDEFLVILTSKQILQTCDHHFSRYASTSAEPCINQIIHGENIACLLYKSRVKLVFFATCEMDISETARKMVNIKEGVNVKIIVKHF